MKKTVYTAISFVTLIFLWYILSFYVNSPIIAPYPHSVFSRMFELIKSSLFWSHMAVTMLRCLSAFVVSVILSLFLGLLCGIFPAIDIFFSLPMNMIKVTPVVSFILLALFWFTSSKVPVFVSVLMSLPVMTTAVSSGIRNSDKKLLQMTIIYNFTTFQKLRWFYIPSMLPYFTAGAITSLGLTWKVVIAGEILSLPKNAVGSLLQSAKVHIETIDVFAITGIVVFFSYFCEKLFSYLIRLLKNKYFLNEAGDK